MTPASVLLGLWIMFAATWVGASLWTRQTVLDFPNRALRPLYARPLLAALLLGALDLFSFGVARKEGHRVIDSGP